jgi:hypothetical protein
VKRLTLLLAAAALALSACGDDDNGGGNAGGPGVGDSCGDPLPVLRKAYAGLPRGVGYRPVPDFDEEAVKQRFPEEARKEIQVVNARSVLRGGKRVAVVIVVALKSGVEPKDVLKGAEEGSAGGDRDVRFGKTPAVQTSVEGGESVVGVPDACTVVTVVGVSESAATQIARGLLTR